MRPVSTAFLISVALTSFCSDAFAQEEVASCYSSPQLNAYAINGAGFAFSPNVSITITALGFGGSDLTNYPYQVSLYNASGNQLATTEVTVEGTFCNATYYQEISPLNLAAGSTYYIGATEAVNGSVNGLASGGSTAYVSGAVITSEGGAFTVNPNISYLGAVYDFNSGIPQIQQSQSIFFVDDNFQFTVVPEPSGISLSAIGLFLTAGYRRRFWVF